MFGGEPLGKRPRGRGEEDGSITLNGS